MTPAPIPPAAPTTVGTVSAETTDALRPGHAVRVELPALRDQTRHKPRQSRTMARHGAFAVLAGV